MADHVFVCYARKNQDFVLKLATTFKDRNVPVWVDQWDISPSADWDRVIDKAIDDCTHFLIVLSPEATKSREVRGELRAALNVNKPIVPVLYQPCRIPRQLLNVHYVDYTPQGPGEIAALKQLLRLLGEPETTVSQEKPAPPPSLQPTPHRLSGGLIAGIGASVLVVVIGLFVFFASRGGAGGEEVDPTAIAATVVAKITAEAAAGITQPEVGLEADVATAVAATQQTQAAAEIATDTPTSTPSPTNTREPPTNTPLPIHTSIPPTNTPLPQTNPAADGAPMVLVPAGPFTMGSDSGWDDDQPAHEVTLDAFYIDQYEVTNEQFLTFLNEQGNQEEGERTWYNPDWGQIEEQGGTWQIASAFDQHPVTGVSWYGAKSYCEWRGDRLPTEAEWEKAARGTDGRTYPWGEERPHDQLLNFNQNVGGTTPVGSYPDGVSPYGAYDMTGNVWEWVADWYDAYPGSDYESEYFGTTKVLRGGSWRYYDGLLRASVRYGVDPDFQFVDYGFRCVRAAP